MTQYIVHVYDFRPTVTPNSWQKARPLYLTVINYYNRRAHGRLQLNSCGRRHLEYTRVVG